MLGDLIFAEPKALIGFAGRRVIEQTLQEQLPDDFQTAEYLLHHGLLDLIVPRAFLKQALSETITLYKEAPLKVKGIVPYGERSALTKVREEQVRRLCKYQQESRYSDLVEELDLLLNVLTGADKLKNFTPKITDTAINLAANSRTQLNWLNFSNKKFQIRTRF